MPLERARPGHWEKNEARAMPVWDNPQFTMYGAVRIPRREIVSREPETTPVTSLYRCLFSERERDRTQPGAQRVHIGLCCVS